MSNQLVLVGQIKGEFFDLVHVSANSWYRRGVERRYGLAKYGNTARYHIVPNSSLHSHFLSVELKRYLVSYEQTSGKVLRTVGHVVFSGYDRYALRFAFGVTLESMVPILVDVNKNLHSFNMRPDDYTIIN